MIELTERKIDEALTKLGSGSLAKYCWIQANVRQLDVRKSDEFQRRFNHFYRVRQKPNSWYESYYGLMESAKNNGIAFPEALRSLKNSVGSLEASFASKLVATLDPNRPVIDRFVLGNFGLRLPYYSERGRENKIIELYNLVCATFTVLVESKAGHLVVAMFNQRFPWAEITSLKKIDLVLWQIRPEDHARPTS